MKKLSRILAAAVAFAMALSFSACSDDGEMQQGTTATTMATTTATMASEDAAVVAEIDTGAEKLANGTLKWFSFWPLEPLEGESRDVFLELFKTQYGGEIEWIQTTNDTKYSDLGKLLAAGDAPDMFPAADLDTFPNNAGKMFQPMDDYIDYSSDLFPDAARKINDLHTLGGKHYVACVSANVGSVIIYNKKTIEDNGLPDPAELVYKNEWTWSAMKDMCVKFADPDAGKYGVDAWWFELGILASTGVPIIAMEDGHLKNNLMDPNLARAQEYLLSFHNTPGLNIPREEFDWTEQPARMGSYQTLFYPVGTWQLYEPNIGEFGKPGELMIVPMPRDEKADKWYQLMATGSCDMYAMCKGAPNPEAVGAFIKCKLIANSDEKAQEINDKQLRGDYGWTDEMIDMFNYMEEINTDPVISFHEAVHKDVKDLISDPIKSPSYHGNDWYEMREEISDAVDEYISDANKQIDKMNAQ